MSEFREEDLLVFLREQSKLFDEPVAETLEEAEAFLEDCMAVVTDSIKEVREYLEEAGQYESSSYYMESLYAQNSLALGDTALAESYYMRIFSHDEPFPSASILEAYMNFGRLLCATGRYSAAESYFTKGIVESEKVRNRRALASMYEGLSEALQEALHPYAVVIVADIGYKTPRRLWCSLISDARVRVSMDMKHSGLLLCNPKLNKQNYYI